MASVSEKLYELSYLASPDLDEAAMTDLKNSVDTLVVKLGGSIREHADIAKHRLAYPVKKSTQAYLVHELINISAKEKTALTKEFQFNPNILRFMFLNFTEGYLKRLREKRTSMTTFSSPERIEKKVIKRATADKPEKSAEEKAANISEIEKKLDEILGREL